MQKILIGSAFGHGAQIYSTADGPRYLKDTFKLQDRLNTEFYWDSIVQVENISENHDPLDGRNYDAVLRHNIALCNQVQSVLGSNPQSLPIVIGGDHSAGIGIWSGVTGALEMQEEFGLIWIDAHMDAHTLESSPSKSYHGMPLAVLLGKEERFSQIGTPGRKIHPKNLVLIGIRSFEEGEEKLLKDEKVKVFFIEEVRQKGFDAVLKEAVEIATHETRGFGISIDLDVFDPSEAPGVGSPELNGLFFKDAKAPLAQAFAHPNLRALEIAEFNPTLDKDNQTAQMVLKLLKLL
jgi:arginase